LLYGVAQQSRWSSNSQEEVTSTAHVATPLVTKVRHDSREKPSSDHRV
jgi:hypothetical protein